MVDPQVPARTGLVRRRFLLGARLALSWRPTGSWLRAMIRATLTSFIALGTALWLLPDVRGTGPWSVLVLVATVAVVSFVLRPVLLSLVVLFGPAGLLLVGLLAQAAILDVALELSPGSLSTSFPNVLLASWIASALATVVNWLFDAGSEDAFLAQVLGRAVRVAHRQPPCAGHGLLIVQLDGVSEPLLRQAVTAGSVPTLSRWLRQGSHSVRGWHTGLPSTTPGGQSVLLHGDATVVPAFRWYEKESGRILVANRPRDCAEIQARMSDGRGLLADGGVSVSNLFTGDAPLALLTMSDALLPPRNTRGLASFASTPGGLPRSIMLFVGEMFTELQQGRRQRRRDVRPRVPRTGIFVLLRAVTTVLLRDLNVTLVAEQMARCAPVIYVDFVDYDEVAHHAGPSRPESMRTLDGLDRVLQLFEQIAGEVDREYEIAVLSDHGQAQGATFEQVTGVTLHGLVESLTDSVNPGREDLDSKPVEHYGPANLLLTGVARSDRLAGGAARTVLRNHVDTVGAPSITFGQPLNTVRSDVVVAASGSLAHIYLPDLPGRLTREQIEARHPRLIDGLAANPGIGLVMVRTDADLVVIGADGWRSLTGPGGMGGDPLGPFGPDAGPDLIALDQRDHVGDVVVLGRRDERTDEVTAFEELVGSHGGLGGGQTSAVLVHPSSWSVGPQRLDGMDVHLTILNQLHVLGLRADGAVRSR
jgi:hypothetical protein